MREENLQNVNISKKSLNLAFKKIYLRENFEFEFSPLKTLFFSYKKKMSKINFLLFKVHSLKENKNFLVNKKF